MKNPWISYTVIRLGSFALVFTGFMLVGIEPILAAIYAAAISLAISLVFFNRQRDALSKDIYSRVKKNPAEPAAADSDAAAAAEPAGGPDAIAAREPGVLQAHAVAARVDHAAVDRLHDLQLARRDHAGVATRHLVDLGPRGPAEQHDRDEHRGAHHQP